MSNSPIEFLDEEPGHDVPRTEMGGADGLIQPEMSETMEGAADAQGGHVLGNEAVGGRVNREVARMMARKAMRPLSSREAWTGEPDDGEEIVDPRTGRVVPPERNETASGGGDALGGDVRAEAGEISGLRD